MRVCITLLALLQLSACADRTTSVLEPRFDRVVMTPRALASGSVHLYGDPASTVEEENYDFNAVRSGPGLEARGHIAWNVRLFNGEVSHGRAEVGCSAVEGNTAWISGPVTSIVVNGESYLPGASAPRWALLRVRDLGEGQGSVDVGSILTFPDVNFMMTWCTMRPQGIFPEFPITRGNISVHGE